jgi:hypothetical protein
VFSSVRPGLRDRKLARWSRIRLVPVAVALSAAVAGVSATITASSAGAAPSHAVVTGHDAPAAPSSEKGGTFGSSFKLPHLRIDASDLSKLAATGHATIGDSSCGSVGLSPSANVTGDEAVRLSLEWEGSPNNASCTMPQSNCGSTYFGDCDAGYWVAGLWCSTLAATDVASAQADCDLNNIIDLSDYNAGPNDPSDNHGTSYNQCSTLDELGELFGGLPGTLQCVADGGASNGWIDNWPLGSLTGTATGVYEQTGSSSAPFDPSASGVDCPPSAANVSAGAIPNMCVFVVMPIAFDYYCVGGCAPDISDPNDGVTELTSDYMATLFSYAYAPSFTSATKASVTSGKKLSFTIATSGGPAPKVSEKGKLPKGITLKAESGGRALLSGTTTATGTYTITLTATNSVSSVTQAFTLTVKKAAAATSKVALAGRPAPAAHGPALD